MRHKESIHSKKEKMWAAEQLRNAYVRMLPLDITGSAGKPVVVKVIQYGTEAKGTPALKS